MKKLLLFIFLAISLTTQAQPGSFNWSLPKSKATTGSLVLDLYPGGTSSYSVRKLRTAYTGPCMKVRRNSDNAEQLIYFLNDTLDSPGLLSFVGSGTGYVVTWYDQVLSNNVHQVTAAVQPTIVKSGILNRINGKPAIEFLTAIPNNLVGNAMPALNAGNDISFFTTASVNTASSVYGLWCTTNDASGSRLAMYIDSRSTPNRNFLIMNTGSTNFFFNLSGPNITINSLRLQSGIVTAANGYPYDNSVAGISGSWSGSYTNNLLIIGSHHNGTLMLNGNIAECLFYSVHNIASRSNIELNIKTFFSTP